MNARERWLETILFGNPDKVPFSPGGGRKSTKERWYKEGLPQDVEDIGEYAYRQAGGEHEWSQFGEGFWVNEAMIPHFEEKILEDKGRTLIVQDWKGNICEISSEYTVEYLRNPIDFVTRRWIKCPVETRDDWEKIKYRYDSHDPSRLPKDKEEKAERLKQRTFPLGMSFPGPFWQLREWLGFENLCIAFHDDPSFVVDMISFWENHITHLLNETFKYIVPDYIRINEDMAFKCFSMISPDMIRKFIFPIWKRWGEIIRNSGCPVYAIDSDGFIGELIPLWIEAGMNACEPIEVAAGCDIVEFRRQFGKKMAYIGGVDKRKIAAGGDLIKEEIKRLEPVIQGGGFIPSCDHGIPADVSWPNYVDYTRILAKATGWL
jgi:hypothetical protein